MNKQYRSSRCESNSLARGISRDPYRSKQQTTISTRLSLPDIDVEKLRFHLANEKNQKAGKYQQKQIETGKERKESNTANQVEKKIPKSQRGSKNFTRRHSLIPMSKENKEQFSVWERNEFLSYLDDWVSMITPNTLNVDDSNKKIDTPVGKRKENHSMHWPKAQPTNPITSKNTTNSMCKPRKTSPRRNSSRNERAMTKANSSQNQREAITYSLRRTVSKQHESINIEKQEDIEKRRHEQPWERRRRASIMG